MADLPTGTVTFLFTDLEGSTRLWEEQPEAMQVALARHDELLRDAVHAHDGHVVKTTGDGLHAVFATANTGVGAAVAGQRELLAESWGPIGSLRVRMGIHTGAAEERDGDYFGSVLNRAARLMAVAHPGQVLCSETTADLVRDSLPVSIGLVELGRHRLRDLARPETVYQVTHQDLPADFPPLRTIDAFPGNLPTQRTPLIGRARELEKLAEVLAHHRVVTLTGVGGVGKTRLAVQLAADVIDRFPDGAWLVALAPIRDSALVANTVAAALNIPERPGRPVVETLRDAIGSRVLLVVLDNCEHLLDACAQLVDELIDACSSLRVVATSREALGVDGEQSRPTPSLGLPEPEAGADITEVERSDAVALFVERARAVRPEFELSPENAAAVAALCARLDGIPLAIELAAARINALVPQDILERIDQRFLLLTGGSRTALERHQTLQAAVDWSYDLLDERERRLFDRLSVFAGGFTLDAARAVAADEPATEVEVIDVLGSLVAKSMIVAEGSGRSVRYRMLETMRQYGRDHLAATEDVAAIRDRHARWVLDFAEALRPSFFGPGQGDAFDRMTLEIDNVRAAFAWLLETGDAPATLRLVASIFAGFRDTSELLRLREAALAVAATLPPGERADPLASTAWSAFNAGEHTRAAELADASLACAQEAGIPPSQLAYETLGLVALWRSEPNSAIEFLDQAVARARAGYSSDRISGNWEHDRLVGDTNLGLAGALSSYSFVLSQAGETERAITAGEEAVACARELRVPSVLSGALFNLALAYQSTDPARAAQLLDESLEHNLGDRWQYGRAWNLLAAGQVHGLLGDHARALTDLGEVLGLARQTGERFIVPIVLQSMARSLRQLDRLDEAALLLGASQGLGDRLGIPGAPTDATIRDRAAARLRELLGADRFEAQFDVGRSMSVDAALMTGIEIAAGGGHRDPRPGFADPETR